MEQLKKVRNPGVPPLTRAATQIDWSPLRDLQVGEAVDVPETAKLTSVSVQLSKLHRAGKARYRRRGRRIWRVA